MVQFSSSKDASLEEFYRLHQVSHIKHITPKEKINKNVDDAASDCDDKKLEKQDIDEIFDV